MRRASNLRPKRHCALPLEPEINEWLKVLRGACWTAHPWQVANLLGELERTLCYNPRRVYATGVSNGGMFLYELAASPLANAFAAFMPIVGSPLRGFLTPHRAGRAVPFFGLWGREDETVPPIANPSAVGHPGEFCQNRKFWRYECVCC